jgi:phage N-6-adenine-methyltransferase
MSRIVQRTAAPDQGEKISDLWRTPQSLYDLLDLEADFAYDLAADNSNKKAIRWFGPGSEFPDGLTAGWMERFTEDVEPYGATGFCNPPYSNVGPWLAKAIVEAQLGFTSYFLVPYDPSTRWWVYALAATEIRRIPRRVRYGRPGELPAVTAMFASAVIVYRYEPGVIRMRPDFVDWDYPRNESEMAPKRAEAAARGRLLFSGEE